MCAADRDSFAWKLKAVALIPTCAECDAHWLPAGAERWAAYRTDDEPQQIAFYCRKCAEREFGPD